MSKRNHKPSVKKIARKSLITALEQRLLLDGAAVATATATLTDNDFRELTKTQIAEAVAPTTTTKDTSRDRHEVAVVDTGIADYQTLVDAATDAGMEVVLLSGSQGDGLDELANLLKDMQPIDALHILSHGSEGEVYLGTDTLNSDTLDSFSQALELIKGSLTTEGDILLYGCNVAQGDNGYQFIEDLAIVTQADIAASDDLTGNAEFGGDWDLEKSYGSIDFNFLGIASDFSPFDGTLGTLTFTGADQTFSTGDTYRGYTLTIAADAEAYIKDNAFVIKNNNTANNGRTNVIFTSSTSFTWTGWTTKVVDNGIAQPLLSWNNGSSLAFGDDPTTFSYTNLYNAIYGPNSSSGVGPTTSVTINFGNNFGTSGVSKLYIQSFNLPSGVNPEPAAPSNAAPTSNANTGSSLNEGATDTITASELDFNDDSDADTAITYTVTSALSNGQLENTDNSGSAITSFTQQDINDGKIVYIHNGGETTSDSFGFKVADSEGAETTGQTFNFTVTAQNDAPTVATNTGLTVNEGAAGTIANTLLNTTDPDDSGTGLTYTITSGTSNGSVWIDADNSGTINNAESALAINGIFTQDDINNNRVKYLHDGSETTSDSFGFSVQDGLENSVSAITGQSFAITVTPQNDAPTATGIPTDITVTEDTASNVDLSAITFADAENSNLTVTLTASAGTLAATSGGGVTIGGSGTAALTLAGSAANINTYLDTASNIKYTGATNANGDNAATLTINANDGTVNPTLGTVNIDITGVNDKPTISGLGDIGQVEGYPIYVANSFSFADVDAPANYNGFIFEVVVASRQAGDYLSVFGTYGQHDVAYKGDEGIVYRWNGSAYEAIATTNWDEANAKMELVFHNGVVTNPGNYSDGTQVTFYADTATKVQDVIRQAVVWTGSDNPTTDNSTLNTRNITFRLSDGTDWSDTTTQSYTIYPANDSPTLTVTGSNATFTENGTAVSLFSGTAIDVIESADAVKGLTFTVTNVVNGADETVGVDGSSIALTDGSTGTTTTNGMSYSVSVSGTTATVTLTKAAGITPANAQTLLDGMTYTNSNDDPTQSGATTRVFSLTQIQDTGGLSTYSSTNYGVDTTNLTGQTSTVTITATNDSPTAIALSDSTVLHKDGVNGVVGTLSTTDADSADSHTYSLVAGTGDTDNASFNINGNELRANDPTQLANGTYSVRVQTSDGNGGTFAETFSITVDAAPTLASSIPADGATNIAPSSDLSLTFSEAISKGTGNITLINTTTGNTVETFDIASSDKVSISGSTLTINPTADLAEATGYAIQVENTAILDSVGNAFAGISDNTTLNFTTGVTDSAAPTFLSIQRVDDNVITGTTTSFTLTFNEAVNAVAGDFELNTSGTVAGTIGTITGSGTNNLTVNVTGISGVGTLGLNLKSDHAVTDLAGNALATAEPADDEVYSVDTVAPTLISMNRLDSATTNADSVQFMAVFSETVTGLLTDDFELTGTAATGASIASVTGTGNGYVITVNGVAGDGTLGVQLKSAATVTDSAGTALTATTASAVAEQYTIDNTAPTATAIIRTNAALSTADTVTFDVTFGEAVANVSVEDFAISGDVTGTITGVTGSGSSYTVTVGSITGDGALGLNFKSGQNIADTAGNSFAGTEPSVDESYTIDNTLPTVASISRGMVNQVKAGTATDVVFTVVFSETVSGVATTDFEVTGNATNTGVSSVSSADGKVFKVTVGGVNGTIGQTVGLNFTGSATDAVSQASTAQFTSGDSYTIAGTLLNEGALTQAQLDAIIDLNREGTLLEQSVADATQVIIVDSRIPGLVEHAQTANPEADIWLLDGSRSAVEQISEILANYNDLDALHILSHGGVGEIYLGAETVSADALNQNSATFAAWSNALSDNGDILLYGCNVAQGDTGIAFINQLAQVTGADIAASDDLTGSAELGGDWVLEVTSGTIESVVSLDSFKGTLAEDQVTTRYLYVHPGQDSYHFTWGEDRAYNGTSWEYGQITEIALWDASTANGYLQYSSDNGANWSTYNIASSSVNYISVTGKIWKWVSTTTNDPSQSIKFGYKVASVSSNNVGTTFFMKIDNYPTSLGFDNTSGVLASDTPNGGYVGSASITDTGIRANYELTSQSHSGLFALDASSGVITITDTSLIPAEGETVSITVSYADVYQRNSDGSVITGQGLEETFSFVVKGASDDLGFEDEVNVNSIVSDVVNQDYSDVTQLSNGNVVVVWNDNSNGGIYGQIYDSVGSKQGSSFTIDNDITLKPEVSALSDGKFVVSYVDTSNNIFAVVVDENGSVGSEISVASGEYDNYSPLDIRSSSDGSKFTITWNLNDYETLKKAVFSSDGSQVGATSTFSSKGYSPVSTILTSGQEVVAVGDASTWEGINIIIDGAPVQSTFDTPIGDTATFHSIASLSNGGFVLAWADSNQERIYTQEFNADGTSSGTATVTNTTVSGQYSVDTPKISVLSDGSYIVTWSQGNIDGSGTSVQAMRFDTNGDRIDSEQFQINQYRYGNQSNEAITELESGGFVTTWTDSSSEKASGADIELRFLNVASNAAPTISGAPTFITTTEDTASNIDLSAVTFADGDNDALTVTLSVNNGTFSTPADGSSVGAGVTETLVNATTITLVGSAADINTYLDTASNIQYTGATNAAGTNAATLTISASDGTANLASTPTVNINITNVNDAPTVANAPSTITVTEDTASNIDLSSVVFADVDNDNLTVTLSIDDGSFSSPVDGSGFGSGVTETLVDSKTITLSGSATAINTYLDTASNIQYTGANNISGNGAATLTISASDANSASLASNPTVSINITSVNDAPTITGASASQAVNDSATATPFSNVVLDDVDSTNVSVTVALDTAAKGAFTAASLTGSGFTDAGSGSYILASTDIASAQAALRQLAYNPADNRVAPGSTETTTFTITVNDGTANGTDNTTTVVSTSVNDTPTDISLSDAAFSHSEGSTNVVVGSFSATDADTGESFTYSLVAGTGDTDNGKFNIDGANLRVTDRANVPAGNYSIRVQVNDGDATYEKAFTITVTDGQAPTISTVVPADGSTGVSVADSIEITFDENVTLGSTGTITLYDITGNGANSVTIDVTNHASQLSVSGNKLTINPSANLIATNQYAVQLTAGALKDSADNGIAAVNDNTTYNFTTGTVDTTAPTVAIVDVADPTQPNAGTVTINFSEQVTGVDISDFTLTLGGVNADISGLTVAGSGSAYTLDLSTVTATAGTYVLTLNTSNITDTSGNALTAGDSETFIIDTTAPTGVAIVRAGADRINGSAATFTAVFSEAITGVDAADFALTGTATGGSIGSVTKVSDSVYTVSVTGLSADGTVGVDLNSTGTGITDIAGNAISSGITGQQVTRDTAGPSVTAINRDGAEVITADTATFTVSFDEAVKGVDLSDFSVSGGTGTVASVIGSGTTYQVTVNSISGDGNLRLDLNASGTGITDAAGNANGTGFTSGDSLIIDNTAPVVTASQSFNLDEGMATGTVIGQVKATDANGVSGFSIQSGNESGYFAIDNNGVLSLTSAGADALDYETVTAYTLNIVATDVVGQASSDVAVTIAVQDINDNDPEISSSATASLAENTDSTEVVYDANAVDADISASYNTIIYSLKATGDHDAFTIDANSGQVELKASADYEVKSSYSFTVIASDGMRSDEQAVTLSITDVNDNTPSFTSGETGSVAENAEISTVIYAATATDADGTAANNTISYSLTGTDANLLNIDSSTGEVTLKTSSDYETKSSYSFNVVASDGKAGTSDASQSVTVSVVDVNETPVANNDTGSATEAGGVSNGTAGSNATGNVLTNDTDVDATDTKTVSVVKFGSTAGTVGQALTGSYGSLTLNSDGSYTYVIDNSNTTVQGLQAGSSITDTFTYTLSDKGALTDTASLVITINGVNDNPTQSSNDPSGMTESADASAQDLSSSGSVSFEDVDAADVVDVTFVSDNNIAWSAGTIDSTLASQLVAGFDVTGTNETAPGAVNWSYSANDANLDFLGAGETITFSYTVTVTDSQNATATDTVTFTITGTNDAPDVTATAATSITEVGDSSAQVLSDTGTVSFTDIDDTDVINVTFASDNNITWSAGTIDSTLASQLVAGFNVGGTGEAAPGSVNWSYSVNDVNLDFLGAGETITFSYTVTVTDSQNATATDTVSFTITGSNDTPVITVVDVDAAITEGSVLSDTGSISFADLDLTDRPTAAEATKSVTAKAQDGTTDLTLTATQKAAIEAAFSIENVNTNTNDGTVNWSYNIAEADLNFLGKDEVVTAVFTITVTDDEGETDTQDVTVTITGSNDTPVITVVDVDAAITEGSVLSDTGSISFADLDLTDRPTAAEATKSVTAKAQDGTTDLTLTATQKAAIEAAFSIENVNTNTNDGTVNWSYNIAEADLNFLGKDEVVTAVFTITVTDDEGETDTQDVTVTITGSNDTPVITVVDVDAAITEGSVLSDTGSISFADLDLTDRPTAAEATKSVTAKAQDGTTDLTLTATQKAAIEAAFSIENVNTNTNDGTVNWSYNIAEADLNFLGKDEVVTAVFTITVTDDEGETDTQDVTVTITGSNDTPVITVVDVDAAITEGSVLSDTGSISFADLDLTDRPTAAEATKSISYLAADGITGLVLTPVQQTIFENAFSITNVVGNTNTGAVNWTYELAESDIDFLRQGETVTAVFTITVTDDESTSTSQDVTVVVTGSNDTPTVENSIPNAEGTLSLRFDPITLPANLFADLDHGQTDSLNWTVANLPRGLSFDASTRQISGVPTAGVGTSVITVTATEADGGAVSTAFNIVLEPAPVSTSVPAVTQTASTSAPSTGFEAPDPDINIGQLPAGTVVDQQSANSGFVSENAEVTEPVVTPFQAVTAPVAAQPAQSTNTADASLNRISVNVNQTGEVVFSNDSTLSSSSLSIATLTTQAEVINISISDDLGALNYSATLADGSVLPEWVTVNAATGEISINPPAGETRVNIRISAHDVNGDTRVLELDLDLTELNSSSAEQNDTSTQAYLNLDEQLELEAQQLDDYGSELMKLLVS